MNNDPENNESLHDALKAYGLKQDINRLHKEMMQSMKHQSKQAPVRPIVRVISAIAASLLFFIIGTSVFVYVTSTSQNLFHSRFHPYQEAAQRGAPSNEGAINKMFEDGQEYLRTGDVAKAIFTFADILSKNARSSEKVLNDDAEYYLALSYLKDEQPENALPLLEKINAGKLHLYHDQVSDWFLMRVKIAAWRNK